MIPGKGQFSTPCCAAGRIVVIRTLSGRASARPQAGARYRRFRAAAGISCPYSLFFSASLFVRTCSSPVCLRRHATPILGLSRRGARRGARPIQRIKENRSEEHTSELQSHLNLVCRLLLEKKK